MRSRRIAAIMAGGLVALGLAGFAGVAVASGHGQARTPSSTVPVPTAPAAGPSAADAVLDQNQFTGITELTHLPAGVASAAYGHGHVTPDAQTGVQEAAFVYDTPAGAAAGLARFQSQVASAGLSNYLVVQAAPDGPAVVTVFGDDSSVAQFLDQFGVSGADQPSQPGD